MPKNHRGSTEEHYTD
jgi:hypothetical protein